MDDTGKEIIMAVSGISSNYYSTYNNYSYSGYTGDGVNTWTENANEATEKLKESLGIESTGKTGSSSSSATTASSASGFLMGYQTALEDLESASESLKLDTKGNVFSKLDSVWDDIANGKGTKDALEKALNDTVSAVKDFADQYNYTTSYLKKNTGHGSGVSKQLENLQRGLPTEKALKTLGMSLDKNGNLQVDETKLKEALVSGAGAYADQNGVMHNGITFDKSGKMQIDSNGSLKVDDQGNLSLEPMGDRTLQQEKAALTSGSDFVKETIGGQYGIADRIGGKATSTLDSSVTNILGSDAPEAEAIKEATESTASTYGSTKKQSQMSDSFLQFASFARSGAYNLTNYYAVSMLNMLV